MRSEEQLVNLLASFTAEGTPLSAIVGNKLEWCVTILTGCMLANENLAASMDAEEMVDAAINYANIIQERLGYYQAAKVHTLEKLLD
jgi:hypothetical protein